MERDLDRTLFLDAERLPEVEVMGLHNALRRQSLLATIMNGMPDGAVIVNAARQIVLANGVFAQAAGRADENEVVGLRPGEAVGCVHAGTSGGCGTTEFCRHCGAAQVLKQGLLGNAAVEECRIMTKAGSGTAALDLLVWGTPIAFEGVRCIFFAVRDISHEKRRRILERVFFHDILNTAGALNGLTKLLLDKAPSHLEGLTQPVSQAAGILLNEIEAQKQVHDAENHDLQMRPVLIRSLEYLTGLVKMYAGQGAARGMKVELAIDSVDLELVTDQVLLNRIMSNLIRNAMEATRSGMTITVGCSGAGEVAEFSVHNPDYMPREVQLQLFNRSFSTKGPGRGLGLYSVKLIAERYLQGRVDYASALEVGTKFFLTLPCHPH
jgi:hypothetical protein